MSAYRLVIMLFAMTTGWLLFIYSLPLSEFPGRELVGIRAAGAPGTGRAFTVVSGE
jgi:hypothetical protein